VPDGFVQRAPCLPLALDHAQEFCLDLGLAPGQKLQPRIANWGHAVLDVALGGQMDRQRPVQEVGAEPAILRDEIETDRLAAKRCGQDDFRRGDETFNETGANALGPPALSCRTLSKQTMPISGSRPSCLWNCTCIGQSVLSYQNVGPPCPHGSS
jgi:hypothetical protein